MSPPRTSSPRGAGRRRSEPVSSLVAGHGRTARSRGRRLSSDSTSTISWFTRPVERCRSGRPRTRSRRTCRPRSSARSAPSTTTRPPVMYSHAGVADAFGDGERAELHAEPLADDAAEDLAATGAGAMSDVARDAPAPRRRTRRRRDGPRHPPAREPLAHVVVRVAQQALGDRAGGSAQGLPGRPAQRTGRWCVGQPVAAVGPGTS